MINFLRRYAEDETSFAWAPPLSDGDTITNSTATLLSGSTTVNLADAFTDLEASFRISGGAAGEDVFIGWTVETANGDTFTETAFVAIRSSADFDAVTPAELRRELRDVEDADEVLAELIAAARRYVEEATGVDLIPHTRTLSIDQWACGGDGLGWWDGVREGAITAGAPRAIDLIGWPVNELTKVEIYSADGTPSVVPSGTFYLANGRKPARVALVQGATWPILYRPADAALITYSTGYANPAAVDPALKRAVIQIAAHWYENRELMSTDSPDKVPMQAGRILRQFGTVRL